MKQLLGVCAILALGAAGLVMLESETRGLPASAEALQDDPVTRAIDEAMYQRVKLLDRTVDFPLPTVESEQRLRRLAETNRSEPRYLEALANAQVALGRFAEAERTMITLADNAPDREAGLRQLAAFYHDRLVIEREVRTLMRLADVQQGSQRNATLRTALDLQARYLLRGIDRIAILRQMIAAQPDEPALVFELVDELIKADRLGDALGETDAALRTYPERRAELLPRKARIQMEAGRERDALAVFDIDFNPSVDLPLFESYLQILRETGGYVRFERELKRSARLGRLDERGFQRHLLLMRSQRNFDEAGRTLERWIATRGRLTGAEMKTFVDTFAAIGWNAAAWKLSYSRFITADERGREDALAELISATGRLHAQDLTIASGGIGLLLNARRFDTGPGVLGGMLSLLYNDQMLDWRLSDLRQAAAQQEHARLFLSLFDRFSSAYPQSARLASLSAEAIRLLSLYRQFPAAIELATRYMNAYPESADYGLVAEAAIDSLTQMQQRDRVIALHRELMNRFYRRGENDRYFDHLSRLVRFHVAARELEQVVKLYWDEINAHPKDEVIYQSFLNFLASNRIYEQELLVYQRAIDNFGSNDYYNKLARWYIREKKNAEFQDLTRRVADIFSESELHEYLKEFLRTARNAVDPDSVFYRTMYEYANRRFPRNLDFVRGLLTYYSRFKLWEDFDALSMRYFYASETIRRNWLWRLSARGRLLALAEQLPGGVLITGSFGAPILAGDLPASPAERLFLAEAARWNSYYEAAVPVYQAIAAEYPGAGDFAAALAGLQRSFGDRTGAEATYLILADLQPHEAKWPTAAGELALERGDIDTAAKHWQRLISIAPADSESYLGVASIFWDYYQFDRARDMLLSGRTALGNETLYGARLAAVYESAEDYPGAVAEYIRAVALNWEDYYQREESYQRLLWLATRRGMGQMVLDGFLRAVERTPDDTRYVQAANQFLMAMKNRPARVELLAAAVTRSRDARFLAWAAAQFRSLRLPDQEEKALRRIIQVEGETPETLFELAAFNERQKQLVAAEEILSRRIQMTRTQEPEALPDYLRALDDAAQFAWRHEMNEKAFAWWETAGRAAIGDNRRDRLHRLAGNLIAREQYPRATALLEELLKGDPAAADLFNTLANIYSRQQDYRGLADLYRRAIESVRTRDNLTAADKLARIEELRLGMIENLVRLGDFTAALDQHIELINRRPENSGAIESAWRFAASHNLEQRLIDYYVRTSAVSTKDYRWNSVLAQIHTLKDSLEDSAAQWRLAIRNEPQRIDLHVRLADVLVKLQQYPDAIQQYREIHRLSGRDNMWLTNIARTQAMSGDLAAARKTLEAVIGQGDQYSAFFAAARLLSSWGDLETAARLMDDGLAVLEKDLYRDPLRREDLDFYIELAMRRGKALDVFNRLLALNRLYAAEAARSGNLESWRAREGQTLTFNTYNESFARGLREYADNAARGAVQGALRDFLTRFPNDGNTIDWVLSVSRNAGFAQLTRDALQARSTFRRGATGYFDHDTIDRGIQFFAQHAAWDDILDILEREAVRIDKSTNSGEHLLLLADIYRARNDGEKEFSALRRWWMKVRPGSQGFEYYSDRLDRYLDLLLARNKPAELAEVTGTPGGYAGQIINGLLARNRTDLALQTVDALTASYSIAWRDSKKLLIATHTGVGLDAVGPFTSAADLMGDMPIGRRLDTTIDPDRNLVGDDWYSFLPHFADWLATQKDERVSSLIIGVAEGGPRDPARQRLIGQWFARHGQFDAARRHFDLALQLRPDDPNTHAAIGEMLLKSGDRAAALEAWKVIVTDSDRADAWEIWFSTLNNNGLLDEAIGPLNAWLGRTIESDSDWSVRSLVNVYAEALSVAGREALIVDLLIERARSVDDPIALISSYQDGLSISAGQRARLMQEIIAAAERLGAEATDGEDDGYYSYPILRTWLESGIELATAEKLWPIARDWLQRYEAAGYTKTYGYLFNSENDWRRSYGTVLLALGERETGIAELQRSLAEAEYYAADAHQAVYEIMVTYGAAREARELMIDFYRTAFARGHEYQSYALGLAEMLLMRAGEDGDTAAASEASAVLSRMVNAVNENADGMRQAAELLERFDRHADARRYRLSLRALQPGDAVNTLRMAIAAARGGDREGALALFRELHAGVGIAREVRLEAIQPYIELFSGDTAGARAEAARYQKAASASEIDLVLQADLLEKAGDQAAARALVDSGLKTLFEPSLLHMKQARVAIAAGDREGAVKLYRAALRNEARAKAKRELFRLLVDLKRHRELLLMVDQPTMEGLNFADEDSLTVFFDVRDAALLPFLASLVESSLAENEFSLALDYEATRVALALRLGQAVTDRSDEIRALQEQAAPPAPPVAITAHIAN